MLVASKILSEESIKKNLYKSIYIYSLSCGDIGSGILAINV